VRAEHVLVTVGHLHGGFDVTVGGALFRHIDLAHALAGTNERVLVFINIHRTVGAEVDRVRTGDPRSVVIVGIKDLSRERLPSSGGAAVSCVRPAIRDGAKILFDLRQQFLLDGVAIRALVGGVHRVRIVEIRRGMLRHHDDHARQASTRPILEEFISGLLADVFLVLIGIAGVELGIRRHGAELRAAVEVAMVVVW